MASMNQTEGVLCISTTWDKTTRKVISNFRKRTLKHTPNEVYCTILDVKVNQEQKEDAARHGVILIPATRPKWSNPAEDPPAINWLLHHDKYYDTGIAHLKDISHVVGLLAKTHSAASAIHENLFPQAKLHQIPSNPAALFVGDSWDKDELGLTGFHRNLVQDFCVRKAKAGEDVKAYSTVLDIKISDDQKTDAESCGVTLIEAQRREGIKPQHDPPRPEWLLLHEGYYPNLGEIENVHYVIGYAPKTGLAAAYIREKLFPGAKLVLINHACPESYCLQVEEYEEVKFEEEMLQMASKADLLFSIGPRIYNYFLTAYQAEVNGKELSEIPHEEILPSPISCSLQKESVKREIRQHQILTCGQIDTKQAFDRCHTMAASIGNAANQWKAAQLIPPKWKIQGVSKQAGKIEVKFLTDKMKCPHIQPTLHPGHSAKSLLTSLRQSHLCLPSSYYTDYSFYGMEAMVSGLPTAVDEYSHLADFIMAYLKEHAVNCVIPAQAANTDLLSDTILKHLKEPAIAFKQAKSLKTDLVNSEDMAKRYAVFTTLLTFSRVQQQTGGDGKDNEVDRVMTDSLPVQIELDDRVHCQHGRESGEEVKTLLTQASHGPVEELMNKLKVVLKRKVEEVMANEDSCKEAKKICMKILDEVDPKSLTTGSLGILLQFLTLYSLYKLKQTCRSGSLARAFETLLITDEMREIAAKIGIKLQLKATYDTEKFEEVEVFFINRDGGGIQPVKFNNMDVKAETLENITFDKDGAVATEKDKIQIKHNDTETGETDTDQRGPQQKKKDSRGIFSKFFKRLTGRKKTFDGSMVTPGGTTTQEQRNIGTASSEVLSIGSVPSEITSGGVVIPARDSEEKTSSSESSEEISYGTSGGVVIPARDSEEKTSSSESSEEISYGTTTIETSEQWSKKILYGPISPKPGQQFNGVRDLAFHNDKLLVCDSDNNIVHMLNQDYICQQVLGSFSGQFAKPFKPWSIAISQDNLYFILDKNNRQIVVCDQNDKVIRKISLPRDSDPWCIALAEGFVIVTEVEGQCVLKYSQEGEYIYKHGSQGVSVTQFQYPHYVAVNSRDVIMVSDYLKHCIKCFDSQFNYLYQCGRRGCGVGQLSFPTSIAVDGADNVYVCDRGNDRISMWSGDGTWRCHLFEHEVRYPEYMAVTADGDRIAVVSEWDQSRDEIVVFSK